MDANQTKIYTAVLIASLVVGVILISFIVSLIQQQRRNNKLHLAKIQAEITTLENERSIGPLLSAIKMKLSSIETQSDEDELTMNQTAEHITDIIHRMREISNNLMPTTLLRKGLTFAIEEFIYKFSNSVTMGTLAISFHHENIPELSKDITINVYRMIQEIIHNTIKHANASVLNIDLKINDSGLALKTEDNGIGFNYQSSLQEKMGLGLRNLISRNDIMGGTLYIDSKPGKGTTYSIEIPI